MPGTNIASMYESLIFRVSVDGGVALELRITYLSHQGVALEVIAPDELAGNTIDLPHVPGFAMPGIRGYHYARRLTPKFSEYLVERGREWYLKRRAVARRAGEIREFLAAGLTEEDVERWIEAETGLRFTYGQFLEMYGSVGGA